MKNNNHYEEYAIYRKALNKVADGQRITRYEWYLINKYNNGYGQFGQGRRNKDI